MLFIFGAKKKTPHVKIKATMHIYGKTENYLTKLENESLYN